MTTFHKVTSTPTRVTTPEVPFLNDLGIRPGYIEENGLVKFTDGVGTVFPTQEQCEQYGYKYNPKTGACTAYESSLDLIVNFDNITSKQSVSGTNNQIASKSENEHVIGNDNTVGSNSNNNYIIGNRHTVYSSNSNSLAIGEYGEVTGSNQFVIGGNQPEDDGARQSIRCIYGIQTTDNSTKASGLNNKTGQRFIVPNNSICYFHAETIAVRIGGSSASGSLGDYGTWVERGVMLNNGGTGSIQRERDTIKTSGTITNWRILAQSGAIVSGSRDNNDLSLSLTCRGQTNMTIEWICNVQITLLKFPALI